MPRQAYRVQGVPVNWGTMAFCPVPSTTPEASSNGANIIVGNPSARVPSPRPASMRDTDWNGGLWQPSAVAPDWISPSIYTIVPTASTNPFVRQGSGVQSPHTVATPAGQITQLVGNWMRRVRMGGRTVTRAVRPFTQWPTYGGGTQ